MAKAGDDGAAVVALMDDEPQRQRQKIAALVVEVERLEALHSAAEQLGAALVRDAWARDATLAEAVKVLRTVLFTLGGLSSMFPATRDSAVIRQTAALVRDFLAPTAAERRKVLLEVVEAAATGLDRLHYHPIAPPWCDTCRWLKPLRARLQATREGT